MNEGPSTMAKQPITAARAQKNSVAASISNCSTSFNSSFTCVSVIVGLTVRFPSSITVIFTAVESNVVLILLAAFSSASLRESANRDPFPLISGSGSVREIIPLESDVMLTVCSSSLSHDSEQEKPSASGFPKSGWL